MPPSFITNPDPNIYLNNNYCILDIETTNNEKGDARYPNEFIYGYYSSPIFGSGELYSLEDLYAVWVNVLDLCSFIVGHGLKFELKWMVKARIPIERLLIYDTLLGEYVIAGNRKFDLGLGPTSRRYGGNGKESFVSGLISNGVCPSVIPDNLLKSYCKRDVKETGNVFLKQRKILKDSGLLSPFFLRCLTTPVLADIEMRGIHLDEELVRQIHRDYVNRYHELSRELDGITGGINMASPQQVAEFLYGELGFSELRDRRGNPIRGKPSKRYPEGNPKTDEDTIYLLRPTNERQRQFLELKQEESKLRKKITGYTENFCDALDNQDGIIYGTLNQSISGTHRLTSSNPNLQNIDRQLKKCINSRHKDWKVRNSDYKTLEMSTAGLLAQDKQCLLDIQTKHDFHKFTAQTLLNKSEISKDERQDAKSDTFKPLYGGQSGTKQQQAYYKAFRERYPDIARTQEQWVREVLDTGRLRTNTGLIFYWPDTGYTSSGYVKNSTMIYNYPVQYFATAELAPAGVMLLWHNMKSLGLKSFIINEIHDNCLTEEPKEEFEIMGNLVQKCMSKDIVEFFKKVINYEINFPIEVDMELKTNWGYEKESTVKTT